MSLVLVPYISNWHFRNSDKIINIFPSKMQTEISKLTLNGITTLNKQKSDDEFIIVQICEFQMRKNKHFIYISDGNVRLKAVPQNQQILNPEKDINSIIAIRSHVVANKSIGIVDFQLLFKYKSRIGNPVEIGSMESENPESQINIQIDPKLIVHEQTSNKKQLMSTNDKQKQPFTQNKPTIVPKSIAHQTLNGNLKDYETIKMLYIGMDRWTIICRIVNLEYKQFVSKNTGKQTKTLNLELMDRAGMKITGVFFGDAAVEFKDVLVKDRVYKISKGQIRQENYNNSKNDKISKFKLVFTSLSSFSEISDTDSIAKNEDSAITLGQCIQKRQLGQQFDVIAILIKVQDTIEVKKDETVLKKTNLLLADPIRNQSIHAVIWNTNLIPSAELIGKAIILSRFKLTQYKNSLNLSSVYRSSIIPVENHSFKQYENKAMNEFEGYEKLHEIVSSGNDGEQIKTCRNIKQLQNRIEQLGYDQWARSDLDVYINRFALKKYHYDGCPHCNKAAENLSNCTHCHKYVEKTVGHFIMGLQVSDSTGSLWTTAYDEWARKIFDCADQQYVINEFLKLDAQQLKQAAQRYQYQQYRLRINTKKDNEGRVKHFAGKIYDRDMADEARRNIEMISGLMLL